MQEKDVSLTSLLLSTREEKKEGLNGHESDEELSSETFHDVMEEKWDEWSRDSSDGVRRSRASETEEAEIEEQQTMDVLLALLEPSWEHEDEGGVKPAHEFEHMHSFGSSDEFAVQADRDEWVTPLDSQFIRSEDAEEVASAVRQINEQEIKDFVKGFPCGIADAHSQLLNHEQTCGAGENEIIFSLLGECEPFWGEAEEKDTILPDPLPAEELPGRGDGGEFWETEACCDFMEKTGERERNILLDPLPAEELSGQGDGGN